MPTAFLGTTTPAEWQTWHATNGQVVEDGVVVRRALGSATVVHGEERGVAIDCALDRCKRLYVLVDDGTIHRYDPVVGDHRHYDDFGRDRSPVEFARPRALCLLGGALFVAVGSDGDDEEDRGGGLFVVPRRTLVASPVDGVRPVDVVGLAASDRRVYLLDAGAGSGTGVVVQIDPTGARVPTPVVEGLTAPTDIAVSADGTLAVLESVGDRSTEGTRIRVFALTQERDGAESLEPRATVNLGTGVAFETTGLAMWPADARPSMHTGRFVVTGRLKNGGGQLRRYTSEPTDRRTSPVSDPIDVQARRVLAVPTASDSPSRYYMVAENGSVVSVAEQVRNRLNSQTTRFDATFVTRFDAGVSGTRWHRLTLDIDEETVGLGTRESSSQVRLQYSATDDSSEPIEQIPGIGSTYASRLRKAGIETIQELALYGVDELARIAAPPSGANALIRSQAQEWLEKTIGRTVEWQSTPALDPRDMLVDATGRYLWVKLELVGSEYTSPRVGSLRAYFPRESYLRYLPSIYRRDEHSAAFLERYLSVPESGFDGLDVNIDAMTGYLDPEAVPSSSLPWLGRWVGVRTDETWSEPVQRAFVSQSAELFRNRGTPHGLLAMLRLYLDPEEGEYPTVDASARDEERSAVNEAGTTSGPFASSGLPLTAVDPAVSRALGLWEHADLDVIDDPGARAAYGQLVNSPVGFIVLTGPDVTDDEFDGLERLVATETPAHTVGRVVRLTHWVRLGGHSYLGLNTALATRELVVGRSVLGVDSMLWEQSDY